MKKIFMFLAVVALLIGCAAKKPVEEPLKEEVIVEVEQNQAERTVVVEDIVSNEADQEVAVEEVVIKETESYDVKAGDNLYDLCLKNDMYIWQVADLNGISDPKVIPVGKTLKLPMVKKKAGVAGNYYKVDIGDNLSGIAQQVHKSQEVLVDLNNLPNKNLIRAGSLLRIK